MKHNILRGKLLSFLKYVYPEGADQETVTKVLFQYHKVEDIEEALEYLADKEYIEKKELPHPYKRGELYRWYKIKPSGIDLLEGNLPPDPGIVPVRE
ncbi:MAG: hypothetical protein LBI86_09725 [Treponema sp.]|jgi:predicted nucleotidyltransferase|nr:hypothetical protein [Treponema sp.]